MTGRQIAAQIAEANGLTLKAIRTHGPGSNTFARTRALAMAAIRKELGWSYPVIGKFFGGFHHTTVIHAVKSVTKVPDLLRPESVEALGNAVAALEQRVRRLETK